MNFQEIVPEDKQIIEPFLQLADVYYCSHCFADIYIWRNYYHTRYAIKNGFLYIQQTLSNMGDTCYFPPIGTGNYKQALAVLAEYAQANQHKLVLAAVSPCAREEIERIFPGMFCFTHNEDYDDYIYSSEDLIGLKGKKYHGKRNFINRFKQTFESRWQYEDITNQNMQEVFQFHLVWCEQNDKNHDYGIFRETEAVSSALKHFDALELQGGLLRVDGRVIAFTIGSKAREDMFVLHFEKADDIPGAYQMINHQFAKNRLFAYTYINREEDLGIEGLRKAKRSYHPVMMGEKYMAVFQGNLGEIV